MDLPEVKTKHYFVPGDTVRVYGTLRISNCSGTRHQIGTVEDGQLALIIFVDGSATRRGNGQPTVDAVILVGTALGLATLYPGDSHEDDRIVVYA